MRTPAGPAIRSRAGLTSLLRAIAFTVGVILRRHGVVEAVGALPVLATLTAVLFGFSATDSGRPRKVGPGSWIGWFLLAPLVAGFATAWIHMMLDPSSALLRTWRRHGVVENSTPVELRARVVDIDMLPERRVGLVVLPERCRLPGSPAWEGPLRPRIGVRLSVPLPSGQIEPPWRPGDLLDVTARLGRPRRFRNPGSFDYASYLAARGVILTGWIKDARLVRRVEGSEQPWRDLMPRVRRSIVARLGRASGPGEGTTAAFLSALLIGEREDIPPDLEQALVRAGVFHIVALSGLNVAIIALLLSFLLRVLPLGCRSRRLGTMLGVGAYWLVARESGSMTRATLMALLLLGGSLAGRRVTAIGSVGVAAALVLLRNPAWVTDVGFQLSFAATLGLLTAAPKRAADPEGISWLGRLGSALARSLAMSAAALSGTALVTARQFQIMTPVALIANLYAVPLTNLLLILAIVIVSVQPVAPCVSGFLANFSGALIVWLGRISACLAAPSWLSFRVLPPPGSLVLWGECAMLLGGALRSRRLRLVARATLALAIVWTAGRSGAGSPGRNLEVTALDVGQGDAIFVRLPDGLSILVDAGGLGRGSFDVGDRVVAPALRALGHLTIDVLVVTHAHRDHLGGAPSIVTQFRPAAIWLGRMPDDDRAVHGLTRLAEREGIPVVMPRRGVKVRIGGALIEVLNPGTGTVSTGPARNDDSLVLRILLGRRAALLTGDLEAPVEQILVDERRNLRADLLKVGHHGSRTSSSQPFLARVVAKIGVICVGANNPWGHPDLEVLERLHGDGTRIVRTDVDGAVRLWTDGLAPWSEERLTTPDDP